MGRPSVKTLDPESGLSVVLIGTGIPIPNPARASAATLVIAGDRAILVDTGSGSMESLAATGIQNIDLILYTHYHWDHFSGLGELMFGRSVAGADIPMPILGPIGAKQVVNSTLDAFALDTSYRIAHHGEHWPEAGMRADVREVEPGVIYDEGGLKITMFDVDHAPIVPAVGYRFDYKGQSVVISGDTKAVPQMVEMARGADILVHEAVDVRMMQGMQRMLQNSNPRQSAMIGDLLGHHTGRLEVAEIAREAGVKKLVLTHLVPSIAPTEAAERGFVRGMAEVFSGEIFVGRDGMEIDCSAAEPARATK